jgi:NAD(P)-dependent dehydrogenase (short-subunit alcohol dehydrogenase family)
MTTPRIALITGAGSGVGRAAAQALAEDGWSCVLVGRRPDALDETRALLAGPERHLAIATDVTRDDQVAALFARVEAECGRLDLLFNNAGTGAPPVPLDELDPAEWRRVVDTNLTASFLCVRAAMGLMKRQRPMGGRIINNGSISAHTPRPNSAAYTATKHAITGLTKSVALDGRAFDIACGQIDIGNAATPMTKRMAGGVPQANGTLAPEPTMDVAHVGGAIRYMASLPADANALFLTVMATQMPFVGRG